MIKNLPTLPEDPGSIPGSGRFPDEGNGYPLQFSYLENSVDRGAWWAIPWGRKESDTTEQLTHKVCFILDAGNHGRGVVFFQRQLTNSGQVFLKVEGGGYMQKQHGQLWQLSWD